MTTTEKETFRARRREAGRQRWAAANPEKAVVRAELLEGATPDVCDRCGQGDAANRPIIDYAAKTITGWRCATCWKTARVEFIAARAAGTTDLPVAA
jgi:hypothetical protein